MPPAGFEETLRAEALATTAASLRETFARAAPLTVGVEEEVMLLDPETLALSGCAEEALIRLAGDERFKRELPAAQLEIALSPEADVPRAMAALAAARRDLAAALHGLAVPAAAGVHPGGPALGVLSAHPRYERTRTEYGPVASRQIVFALQVHVAIGDPDCALAVYNAARSYLPLLAALAANAPFYGGVDSGMASVRPKLCELLPRQGIPPVLASWEEYAQALRWGARSGFFPSRGAWWWELRLHPRHGTLEFRVPDAQTGLAEAAGVVAVAQALVAWLAERHRSGEPLPEVESWRIDENRWSACRHGVEGQMADLLAGELTSTRAALGALLDSLQAPAAALGASSALEQARAMVARNGSILQREAARGGERKLLRALAERFVADLDSPPGALVAESA